MTLSHQGKGFLKSQRLKFKNNLFNEAPRWIIINPTAWHQAPKKLTIKFSLKTRKFIIQISFRLTTQMMISIFGGLKKFKDHREPKGIKKSYSNCDFIFHIIFLLTLHSFTYFINDSAKKKYFFCFDCWSLLIWSSLALLLFWKAFVRPSKVFWMIK